MVLPKVLTIVFLIFCGIIISTGIINLLDFLIEERRKKK